MQLTNKKQLPEMTRPPPNPNVVALNVASTSGTTTNPPVPSGIRQSTQSSTMETVIEPVGPTRAAQTSQAIPITRMAASTFQVDPTISVAAQTSQAIPTSGMASSQGFLNLGTGPRIPYGMPTSLMQGLHTNPSASLESLNVQMPQLFNPGASVPFRTSQQSFTPFGSPQQSLTNASLNALRQQMEETNHEMVNLVTQQVGTVINPLIRDTNNSYQALSLQME